MSSSKPNKEFSMMIHFVKNKSIVLRSRDSRIIIIGKNNIEGEIIDLFYYILQ